MRVRPPAGRLTLPPTYERLLPVEACGPSGLRASTFLRAFHAYRTWLSRYCAGGRQRSSPKVVTGLVDADGTVTDGNGGLCATVLAEGFYALTYDGSNPSHRGIVTLGGTSLFRPRLRRSPEFPRMTPGSRVRSAGHRRLESSSTPSDTTDPRRRSTSTSTSPRRPHRGSWPVRHGLTTLRSHFPSLHGVEKGGIACRDFARRRLRC